MDKIYFAKLNETKTGLKIEEHMAELNGDTVRYSEGGFTHILFHSAMGKARRDFGIGLTPEEAAKSFRDGKIEEAKKLEAEVRELNRLAALEIMKGA